LGAELAALLQSRLERTPKQSRPLSSFLNELLTMTRMLDASDTSVIRTALGEGQRLFLASQPIATDTASLGDELCDSESIRDLAADIHGLPARLIALPSVAMQLLEAEQAPELMEPDIAGSNEKNRSDLTRIEIPQAPSRPPVSRFNQNSDENRDFFIAGEGVLEETLACFQMLTKLMNLPFRRDAIERVLRDQLRRGQSPTLRLCGQIAAGLGLHVSGAKVAALMGMRLQTPTLVPWGQAFALAVRSDQRGLVLASPSQGFVELDADQLEHSFPEGIDLLLMDRTSTTPEQNSDLPGSGLP